MNPGIVGALLLASSAALLGQQPTPQPGFDEDRFGVRTHNERRGTIDVLVIDQAERPTPN